MRIYHCPKCGKPMIVQPARERCWCPNKCLEKLVASEKKAREELLERRKA